MKGIKFDFRKNWTFKKKFEFFFDPFNFLRYECVINGVNYSLIASSSLNLTLERIKVWKKSMILFLIFLIIWTIIALLTVLITYLLIQVYYIWLWKALNFEKIQEFFFDFLNYLKYYHVINPVNYLLIPSRSLNLT